MREDVGIFGLDPTKALGATRVQRILNDLIQPLQTGGKADRKPIPDGHHFGRASRGQCYHHGVTVKDSGRNTSSPVGSLANQVSPIPKGGGGLEIEV